MLSPSQLSLAASVLLVPLLAAHSSAASAPASSGAETAASVLDPERFVLGGEATPFVSLGADAPADEPASVHAQESSKAPATWVFTVMPYFWMAGIDGDVGIGGSPSQGVDISFDDIWSDLQWAFMVSFDARYEPTGLGFFIDSLYMNINQSQGPVDFGFDMRMLEADLTWRPSADVPVDILAGARAWWQNADLDISGIGSFDGDKSWVDPLVGARGTWQFDEHWGLFGRADIGGFGLGSEFSWQALGWIDYSFNDHWSAQLGYRYLSIDYESGGYLFDVALSGPLIGVAFSF